MKSIFVSIFLYGVILCSCSKEGGSLTGSWVTSGGETTQDAYGFTLQENGTAKTINVPEISYDKWEKSGDRLIISGKNETTGNLVSDTLKIISAGDEALTLQTKEGKQTTYTKTVEAEKIMQDTEQVACYSYQAGKDTAFLKINIINGIVSGQLDYQFFEKDANHGTVKGKVSGDTLLLDYQFSSEGQKSVREVIMLRSGNNLTEGFGDVVERQGKTQFADHTHLNFKQGLDFKKTTCQ